MFQCYSEDKTSIIPETISSVFGGGNIKLNGIYSITSTSYFITDFFVSASTEEQWKILNLTDCHLLSIRMNSLLEHVVKKEKNISTLEYVNLSENGSSPWGVYCVIIRHCYGNDLTLCGEDGLGDHVSEVRDSLEANSKLTSLKLQKVQSKNYYLRMFYARILH